jgi:hypothetical protein
MSGNITIRTYSNNILKLSLQKHIEMKENLPYFELFNRRLFSNIYNNLEHGIKLGIVTTHKNV